MRNVTRRLAAAGKAWVICLACAAVALALMAHVTADAAPKTVLVSGTDFTITGTVTDPSGCSVPALLYPGAQRCFTYSVQNHLNVPITVTTLGISAVSAPSGCPVSNLDLTHTNFSGSFGVSAGGNASSPGLPISLVDTSSNQDACKRVTFNFTYSGTATAASPTTSTTESPGAHGGGGGASGLSGPGGVTHQAGPSHGGLAFTGIMLWLLLAVAAALLVSGSVILLARRRHSRLAAQRSLAEGGWVS